MNWLEQWKAISARIAGIEKAGNLMALTLSNTSADNYSAAKKGILPALEKIDEELRLFFERHKEIPNEIPDEAKNSIDLFIKSNWKTYNGKPDSITIVQSIVPLIAFHSEFEYLIKNSEVEGVVKTERAFEHLQRLIAVDSKVKEIWNTAFNNGETKCESLGSVHLLSHGVWAFKINAEKARTDLVYNDSIDEKESSIRRSSPTLVLTEWKIADQNNYPKKIEEAKNQIKDYKSGVLNDIELKQTRYIILVSKQQIKLSSLEDKEDDITYRYINIAVEPLTPSENAIKQSRQA